MRSNLRLLRASVGSLVRLHVRSRTIATGGLGSVVHRHRRVRLLRMLRVAAVRLLAIRIGGQLLGPRVLASVVVVVVILTVAIVPAGRLGDVRDDLHASWNGAGRATAPGCVGRGGRPAETLVELLQEGAANIVRSNVDRIGDAHDDKRTLRRQRQTRVRGIETSTGGFLDLLDAAATLADDRADEDMGDEESQRVRLGMGIGRFSQRLVVKSPDDQAESLVRVSMRTGAEVEGNRKRRGSPYLCDGIDDSAHSKNALNSTLLIVADGTLGARHLADLRNVLATLADDGRGLGAGDDGADVNPSCLVVAVGGRIGLGCHADRRGADQLRLWGIGHDGVALRIPRLGLFSVGLGRAVRRGHRWGRGGRSIAVALGQ